MTEHKKIRGKSNLISAYLLHDRLHLDVVFSDGEPKDATVVAAKDVNTRLFTNDANTNNAIASGLLGVGIGVGGVLLTQAFLDAKKDKERCQQYYNRYKRDDAIMGRLFGLGGGNNYPKPCPPPRRPHNPYPQPQQPYPHPQQSYPQPHRPPYHNPPPAYNYAPAYPQPAPRPPTYPTHHNQGYRNPAPTPAPVYNTPKPNYHRPEPYRPTPSYQQPSRPINSGYQNPGYQNSGYQNPGYPVNSGYAPSFQGRSVLPATEEVKEEDKTSAKTQDTGSRLGAIRFDE